MKKKKTTKSYYKDMARKLAVRSNSLQKEIEDLTKQLNEVNDAAIYALQQGYGK